MFVLPDMMIDSIYKDAVAGYYEEYDTACFGLMFKERGCMMMLDAVESRQDCGR